MADRGLYARWLFEMIQACQWHPLLRIHGNVKAPREGSSTFEWSDGWVKHGERWSGAVKCFAQKPSRLHSTLLMAWEVGDADPWIVLTDLAVDECTVAWYGMRSWTKCGFKDGKRGGFDWQYSQPHGTGKPGREEVLGDGRGFHLAGEAGEPGRARTSSRRKSRRRRHCRNNMWLVRDENERHSNRQHENGVVPPEEKSCWVQRWSEERHGLSYTWWQHHGRRPSRWGTVPSIQPSKKNEKNGGHANACTKRARALPKPPDVLFGLKTSTCTMGGAQPPAAST